MDFGMALVAAAYTQLQIDEEWVERHERGFTWWAHDHAQRFTASEPFEDHGFTLWRVTAETDLLRGELAFDERLAALLAQTSLSGLVALGGTVRSTCSVLVHEGNVEWLVPIFVWAATAQVAAATRQAEPLATLFGLEPAVSHHPAGPREEPDEMLGVLDDVPGGDEPSPFGSRDELEQAATALEAGGAAASVEGTSLTSAFAIPVEERGEDPPAAIVQLHGGASHPALGSGLLGLLMLPPQAAERAPDPLELNRLDAAAPVAHHLGSWTTSPHGDFLAFNAFLPSLLFMPGLAREWGVMLAARAKWFARTFLSS